MLPRVELLSRLNLIDVGACFAVRYDSLKNNKFGVNQGVFDITAR